MRLQTWFVGIAVVCAGCGGDDDATGEVALPAEECRKESLDDSAYSVPSVIDHRDEAYGALHNPTGRPIGGGPGYGAWVTRPAAPVRTAAALRSAVAAARAGDVVYVADDASIDLSRTSRDHRDGATSCLGYGIDIPAGVTIASGRGQGGSRGALLYTTTKEKCALFRPLGSARITGLRLRGPDPNVEQSDPALCAKEARGIQARFSQVSRFDIEIDNNELSAWPGAAVSGENVIGLRVHHNWVHHNRRQEHDGTCWKDGERWAYGLGYGVSISRGHALVEGNNFDNNRHDVASDGAPGSQYEARYNVVGLGAIQHSFDVHGGADRGTCNDVAGTFVLIHHNTVLQTNKPAVHVRGVPLRGAWIYKNQVRHTSASAAFKQSNAFGRFYVEDNLLGG